MLGFLSRLFRSEPKTLVFAEHWCDTPIKLSRRIRSPLGSQITAVKVQVDIRYRVVGNDIALRGVQLTPGQMNVAASATGEAWNADKMNTEMAEAGLSEAVLIELNQPNSWLWSAMHSKWRKEVGAP